MQNVTSTVTSIIPTNIVSITQSAKDWIEMLYESGAVFFDIDGAAHIDDQIRELVRAMHAILSGGQVEFDIVQTGGRTFENLENVFERAWDDSDLSNKFSRLHAIATLMP